MTPVRAALFAAVGLAVVAYPLMRDRASNETPAERTFLFDLDEISEEEKKEEGHAWEMFEWWHDQRAYPNEQIPASGFFDAWEYARTEVPMDDTQRGLRANTWTSIGPNNVGGRMLAVVVDPNNASRVWAGAASGGLWLSTSAGEGASAWTRMETGYPTLSVSAITMDPGDSNDMLIGTGEISRYVRPLIGTPGSRSSYGMGILRSTDGGATWDPTDLTWTFDQSRAVLALRLDPSNSNRVWAATSEGVYRSTDGGSTWSISLDLQMCMDVVVDPTDGSVLYASVGQLGVPDDTQAGIWKTTDGGASWIRLGGGLPTTNFGRTPLTISSDGTRVYAGVSNAVTRQVDGLYRSSNGGSSWTRTANQNWASSQAWYDNTIAVSPTNRDLVLCGGLDCYRTTNGGANLNQVSRWYLGYDGVITPGGPEGPSDYVHADHHAITFDPSNSSIVYIACDGGIFKSTNAGVTWAGKNGDLRTTQFYNGLAIGYTTNDLVLGGLQDNGTVKYIGSDAWSKVFGGDGGWCAIDPTDEDVLYEEYVYLNMHKSTDGGVNWFQIHPGSSGSANFIAPFVIAESSPNILYGGRDSVRKTTNGGGSWFYPDGDSNWNGTAVATIGVSRLDEDYVMAGTGDSGASPTIEMRVSTNGGSSWSNVTAQLPNRYPTDFSYDPNDKTLVWAAFSGYGTGHVFRSTDSGTTWADASGNLPDIPAQSIVVDPSDSAWIYVGTDLGVYRSTDSGASWTDYGAGMPTAMVLDLVIHLGTRRMRAATFGNGIYEVDLPAAATGVAGIAPGNAGLLELEGGRPNPFRSASSIRFSLMREAPVDLTVHDVNGRLVRTLIRGARAAGSHEARWDGRDDGGQIVAAGTYFVRLVSGHTRESTKITRLQ